VLKSGVNVWPMVTPVVQKIHRYNYTVES
jgi:hypothetical protein